MQLPNLLGEKSADEIGATTKVGEKYSQISKQAMQSVTSLKEKIADPKRRAQCIADLENMIRTKESHLTRAEWCSCCGNIRNLACGIESELRMLQNILEALKKGDSTRAYSLLEDYIAFLQRNYAPEPERW